MAAQRITTAPDLTCPVFRARVLNAHAAKFEGPNALDIARSLGIYCEDVYWDIVEGALTFDV